MNRLVIVGLSACLVSGSFAHKIRIDFDHSKNFSSYRTYQWVATPESPSPNALFPNQLMQERITGFIDEALAAKGIKRVATGGDLLVSYKVKVTETPQYTTIYDGGWPGWGWDWEWTWGWGPGTGISTTTVTTFYDGTLVVNLVDAHRNQLVFQGASTQSVSSRAEKNTKKLAKAVNEVFERYP